MFFFSSDSPRDSLIHIIIMQMFAELPNHQNHHHEQSSSAAAIINSSDEPESVILDDPVVVDETGGDENNGAVAAGPPGLMMDQHDEDDLDVGGDSLGQICRLCLKLDDLMISIYDRLDPNPNKRPLHERIEDMFHVKVRALA